MAALDMPPSVRAHWNAGEKEYNSRGRHKVAPTDGAQTVICAWVWGTHQESMLQALVLGYSLHRRNCRADLVLCVENATLNDVHCIWARLLRCFWHIVPFDHMALPRELQGSEQQRLTGVYSKLMVWKVFAEYPRDNGKVVMMDVDMLVRTNIDELFAIATPGAVWRGAADSCLTEGRPSKGIMGAPEHEIVQGKKSMQGGINGGLILLTPSIKEFQLMEQFLFKDWRNRKNRMAEQEFLSFWFGREESPTPWQTVHKKFNFQLHQMFLNNGPRPPPGQSRASSFWHMCQYPEQEVAVWHYSSNRKPVHCLLDYMNAASRWSDQSEAVSAFVSDMAAGELRRPKLDATHVLPHISSVINPCNEIATTEWLESWQGMWPLLCLYVADSASRRCLGGSDGRGYECFCGQRWLAEDRLHDVRDHLLVNCPALRSQIKLPLSEMFDLETLFLPPSGALVGIKMNYLAAVLDHYQSMPLVKDWCGPLDMVSSWISEAAEPYHLRMTLRSHLMQEQGTSPLPPHLQEEANKSQERSALRDRFARLWIQLMKLGKDAKHFEELPEDKRRKICEMLDLAAFMRRRLHQAQDDRNRHRGHPGYVAGRCIEPPRAEALPASSTMPPFAHLPPPPPSSIPPRSQSLGAKPKKRARIQ